MKSFYLISFGALLMSACASLPQPDRASPNKLQLTARTLSSGDCGLFVWTADEARRFVLFTRPSGQDAVWHDGNREISLKLSSLPPPQAQALPPKQTFTVASGMSISLDMRLPQVMPLGTRYKSGLLRLRPAASGDVKVVPVVGLATCQI